MPAEREDKPPWSRVPARVKAETEAILGAHVTRAMRAYGGYGPSATFVLSLDDGRRAFFKGVYPLPQGSAVKWRNDEEERVYEELAQFISPWAPTYYGSLRVDGWHALLIEAVPGRRVPPWTSALAHNAVRSYAAFHSGTVGTSLPEWLARDYHLEFTGYWHEMTADAEVRHQLVAKCTSRAAARDATDWLTAHGAALADAEGPLRKAKRVGLLHFDTRSDNIRIDDDILRIFDWP